MSDALIKDVKADPFCDDADYMQNKFVDWLLAEREEHDAE